MTSHISLGKLLIPFKFWHLLQIILSPKLKHCEMFCERTFLLFQCCTSTTKVQWQLIKPSTAHFNEITVTKPNSSSCELQKLHLRTLPQWLVFRWSLTDVTDVFLSPQKQIRKELVPFSSSQGIVNYESPREWERDQNTILNIKRSR